MAIVNHAKKEINAKIVYFGSAGSGKSTALRYIFSRIKPSLRGELKNVPAGADNLLFFDFSPFDGPLRDGYRVRLHVYTLTGRVTNPATWKMTLKGADGLILMLDDSPDRIRDAQESVFQLRDFLSGYGVGLHDTPAVLQLNRFEPEQEFIDPDQIASSIDLTDLPCCLSTAATGKGVLEALATLSRLVLGRITEKESGRDENPAGAEAADSKGIPDPPDDNSTPVPTVSSAALSPTSSEEFPAISLAINGAVIEGSTLRIPLDIHCGTTGRRVIITVSVDPEQAHL